MLNFYLKRRVRASSWTPRYIFQLVDQQAVQLGYAHGRSGGRKYLLRQAS